ncbi:hypothetical protein LLH06_16685 [Mucilaginibacter daejeonensis]|uniref:hypothetical protein n=1 Tax=Mucilaginibacter daejeonensis TaxID=398049 RepID=UPI001D17A95D|nr:hypothetical protein [Mucilaginibacter daejeonensis]UEG52593.1 hypothetical protein LLH06_16685 [Mucilaginibacter daejeonensis]
MKTFLISAFGTFALALTSCKSDSSGRYVVYKVTQDDQHFFFNRTRYADNDTAFEILQRTSLSKQYNIKYQKDFASITGTTGSESLILAMDQTKDGNVFYKQEIHQDEVIYRYILYPTKDTLMLAKQMLVPLRIPFSQPAQLGGSLITKFKGSQVICYLSKAE